MSFLMSLNAGLIAALGPAGPVLVLGGLGLVMIVATLPFMLNRGPDPFASSRMQPSRQAGMAGRPKARCAARTATSLTVSPSFWNPRIRRK